LPNFDRTADIAAADDDDIGGAVELGQHPVRILAGADAMDADQVMAAAAQPARRAAGGPDHLAIADGRAVGQGHLVRGGIDRGDPLAQQHVHLALFPEGGGADQDAVEGLLAREIFLGEGRALIGQLGLVADHGDAAFELVLAKRHRGLSTAMAGPDDQHVIMRQFRISRYRTVRGSLSRVTPKSS
jgi:hypothetical protein